jgi:hypothetical protein
LFGLSINNNEETALLLSVTDSNGTSGYGLFHVGRDGKWQPVFVPGQELPGGGRLRDDSFHWCSINDAGAILFLARREGERQYSAFLWEQGKLSSVLAIGTAAPDGGRISSVSAVFWRNVNREVIVTAAVSNRTDHGIYRVVDGNLIPVAVPGQPMPGGGVFKTVRYSGNLLGTGAAVTTGAFNGAGGANMNGQFAFLATLQDSTAAIYVLEPDGNLSLVLQQGQDTEQGKITYLGSRLSNASQPPLINSKGEIAVQLEIDNGPRTIALLQPANQ